MPRRIFTRLPWLIQIEDLIYLHVCHDSFTWSTCLIYTCAMTHSNRPDSFTRVPWLIHVCHDSFTRVPWLIHSWAMTHLHGAPVSCIRVPWLISMLLSTHSPRHPTYVSYHPSKCAFHDTLTMAPHVRFTVWVEMCMRVYVRAILSRSTSCVSRRIQIIGLFCKRTL